MDHIDNSKQIHSGFVRWIISAVPTLLVALSLGSAAGVAADDAEASKMHFIVQLHGTREGWPEKMTAHEEEVMTDHYHYLVNLMHDGKMLLAGPAPGLYGLVVLEVASEDEARAMMDKEPSVAAGVHKYTLHPFVASLLYGRDRVPAEESDLRIEKEANINAPLGDVWHCWTTTEGMQSFLVKTAIIELKVGGKYELHFADESPWGQRGSEGCRVLMYLPKRLLSFTWNAPPQFEKERFMRTRVVVELEPVGDNQTHVRMTHLGFGTDGQWNEVYQYFDRAWGFVLNSLKEHFKK